MATGEGENWQGGSWKPGNTEFFVADMAGNSYGWVGYKVILRYRLLLTDVANNGNQIPTQYELSQNYPNPFNPSTTIEFALPKSAFVTLRVYDLLGRQAGELVSEKLGPGTYKTQWDASGLSSGVYFYRLTAGDFVETKKLLLLR